MSWTRLIRFVAEEDGETYYGDCVTPGDIGLAYARNERIRARPIALATDPSSPHSADSDSLASSSDPRELTVKTLLSPLARDSVSSIRGLGLQYSNTGPAAQPPPVACLFLKPPSALAGPGEPISIPVHARDELVDYEVELCVVIGDRDCPKDTPPELAMSYVEGYTVVNDVSSRGLCAKGGAGQWGMGKNYDSWCPIGPCIVNARSLTNPDSLAFNAKLNGRIVQEGNTRDLLVSIPNLIANLSRGSTIGKRSLILTGSPIAVGRKVASDHSDQSPFMKDGDRIECWVEGIGTLVNTVKEETEGGSGTMIRPYRAKL